jgi:HNH endonuclease
MPVRVPARRDRRHADDLGGMVNTGAFDDKVKAAIYQRARGACDRCGLRVDGGLHFHHRTPRRMGGTDRAELGWPSNGLLLHPHCHDVIESRRKIAAELGYLVGYGSNPVDVPVMLWSGWAYLNHDGTVERLTQVPPVVTTVRENVPPWTPSR